MVNPDLVAIGVKFASDDEIADVVAEIDAMLVAPWSDEEALRYFELPEKLRFEANRKAIVFEYREAGWRCEPASGPYTILFRNPRCKLGFFGKLVPYGWLLFNSRDAGIC